MAETLFSIVTFVKDDARALLWTAKSLAVQFDAPTFEWIVLCTGTLQNPQEVLGEFAPASMRVIALLNISEFAAYNRACDEALGTYLWFMKAGDCFPDSRVLRQTAQTLAHRFRPDVLCGAARVNGEIRNVLPGRSYLLGAPTHFSAMVFNRKKIGALRFDEDSLHPLYRWLLEYFYSQVSTVEPTSQVLCDCVAAQNYEERLQELRAIAVIRRNYLKMDVLTNKALQLGSSLVASGQYGFKFLKRLGKRN